MFVNKSYAWGMRGSETLKYAHQSVTRCKKRLGTAAADNSDLALRHSSSLNTLQTVQCIISSYAYLVGLPKAFSSFENPQTSESFVY